MYPPSLAHHHIVVVSEVLDFSFCVYDFGPSTPVWIEVRDSLQFALAAVMCLLVTANFIVNLRRMYKATNEWRANHYLNLLAREGMLYFLAYVHVSYIPSHRVTVNITHVHLLAM